MGEIAWSMALLMVRLLLSLGALLVAKFIYNWVTSPIKHIPGPILAKFTNLGRMYDVYKGRPELELRRWHQKYGSVVRIGPTLVNVSDPAALKVIYSRKNVLQKVD